MDIEGHNFESHNTILGKEQHMYLFPEVLQVRVVLWHVRLIVFEGSAFATS